jgi:hypothetical protein
MNKNTLTLAIVISASLILVSLIFVSGYKYKFKSSEAVSVVGMAQVDFTSDLIVWEGNYNRKSLNLKSAYVDIKQDELMLREYLNQKGIPDTSVIFGAVNLSKEFNTNYGNNGEVVSNTFSGYVLTQNFKIESKEISKVEKLSREATELIEKGIELNSFSPRYYYTKLADLKMDLLSKASADAKQRANVIAESVGSDLGYLKKAIMGVFQITGKNSNEEYSYGGSYNTSEKNKTASITIRMDYGVK